MRKRFGALLAVAMVTLTFTALVAAPGAQAAPTAVANASLTWRVSQQAWTASSLSPGRGVDAPATIDPTTATGTWTFPTGTGTYDPDTSTAHVEFSGALFFGNTVQGNYGIKIANLTIDFVGGVGTLQGDVSYRLGGPTYGSAVEDVVVVTFTGTPVVTTGHVALTVTPDFPFVNGVSGNRGFPASFTNALDAGLRSHFVESGAGADVNKPPAPFTLGFDFTPPVVEPEPEPVASATEPIKTTVSATGALTISVEAGDVVLPTPVLSTDGQSLVTSGPIKPVTVVDLRTANPGWNVNGQVSAFTGLLGGTFGADRLGWTPAVVSTTSGQTVTAGAAVAPGAGLGVARPLASATAGQGRGTAVLGAGLDLRLPTSVAPDTYSATLTLTAI